MNWSMLFSFCQLLSPVHFFSHHMPEKYPQRHVSSFLSLCCIAHLYTPSNEPWANKVSVFALENVRSHLLPEVGTNHSWGQVKASLGALNDTGNMRHLQEWTDGVCFIFQSQQRHTEEIRMVFGQSRKNWLCFRQPVYLCSTISIDSEMWNPHLPELIEYC